MTHSQTALGQYRAVGVHGGVSAASPHQLITLLLNGALDFIAAGKGFMERGNLAGKGEKIGRAIAIVDSLRAALDHGQGGPIAANLASLYDYMEQRLLLANLESRPEILDEVTALLREIKLGWDMLPMQLSEESAEQQR
jgi:flagellar protein FliS